MKLTTVYLILVKFIISTNSTPQIWDQGGSLQYPEVELNTVLDQKEFVCKNEKLKAHENFISRIVECI